MQSLPVRSDVVNNRKHCVLILTRATKESLTVTRVWEEPEKGAPCEIAWAQEGRGG